MSELSKRFGEKIRSVRTAKGISQDKLAVKSQIDRSYIGRIDRGEVNITMDKLYILAAALECKPQDLLPEMD
ncbi:MULTISPECIES: helix-turn-helix domain-containing protein [Colwelliaceae]|jgi:transcriptional regulator with XRE-family HTH domain|uniref:Helix-turn-helix transcriptional regulator n=2 Tax=Colwelliaceae TaxID=267889 RepID=A0A5C6Q9M1_9GAMM|nr:MULTISPECIES: helix-turn-helix transcriptional regulator [Colwelliaceae]ASP47398.1 XRE family transcriptional regulator [Cognaticolwellia beringensis]TWX53055.1 helix-turn-helix transcriptional regulator [Colwellia hornerae]TWX59318.1 helix-turn-helix transcriptional regulator [Colwellia hornerae]TWX65443.1 helix-turn-helix transcriptional regulator [Colwellia hornerae]|tara:strand:- start:23776 stop:23991 length:216 start_codon:yes stop_codon:yes gene_type:complete